MIEEFILIFCRDPSIQICEANNRCSQSLELTEQFHYSDCPFSQVM